MNTIFVTGSTGAIGSALLGVLLEFPDTQLRLLIRAASDDELDARLDTLFRFLAIDRMDVGRRSRVHAVRGDACAPEFGLDAATYAELARKCTHVVHCAGAVRMNLPLGEARRSALGSAKNVIAFARASSVPKKVEFVSTVGIGGRADGVVAERWVTDQRDFHNTYEQAKAEAEDLARVAVERGLPLTVHRPSMVIGDSRTGAIIHHQVFYHLCEFLSGKRTLGLGPSLGDARLDVVPVDFVARAIAWSCTATHSSGRVLHLCSGPESVRVDALQRVVRTEFSAAGQWLPPQITLSPRLFMRIVGAVGLFAGAKARRAIGTLPVFLDYLGTRQSFANAETQALFAPVGLQVPPAMSYLSTVLRRYLQRADSSHDDE